MNDINNEISTRKVGQSFAIPIAIVLGFGLIAAAIFFSGNKQPTDTTSVEDGNKVVDDGSEVTGTINPVTEADHILGNPNAPIVLVEYSDFDCPFCKVFHETMHQIMDEFGVDGKVAWVYRHLPLQSLHPSAPRLAEASECVAKLGGDEAFWKFADLVFGERAQNAQTNMTLLPSYAEAAGVSIEDFNTCLESGEMRAVVEEDFNNAVSIGARGTPYTVVVVGTQQGIINGAQPISVVRQIVSGLIGQLSGTTEETPAE